MYNIVYYNIIYGITYKLFVIVFLHEYVAVLLKNRIFVSKLKSSLVILFFFACFFYCFAVLVKSKAIG